MRGSGSGWCRSRPRTEVSCCSSAEWIRSRPIKDFRLVGDARYRIFRFQCVCGRDSQRPENDLLEIAARYRDAFPGRRIEIDIVRLDQHDYV